MDNLDSFDRPQIETVNNAVSMAEELVSNYYKMSASQWLRQRYDIKTLKDLEPAEIVHGPFAQIIRYRGQPKDCSLGSPRLDFAGLSHLQVLAECQATYGQGTGFQHVTSANAITGTMNLHCGCSLLKRLCVGPAAAGDIQYPVGAGPTFRLISG